MKQLINWKNLIPRVVILAVLIAAYVLFMGTLIKFAIVKGCEAGFGAKTEIQWLNFSLSKAALSWGGFTIANKKDPWKNLIEIQTINTKLNGEQLFYKRFVMDDMTVAGIRTGTARRTWGGLVKKEPAEKKAGVDFKQLAASLQIDPAKALAKTASVGPLSSKEEYVRVQKENTQKLEAVQNKVDAYDVNKELQAIDLSALQDLDKIKDITQLQQKLKAIDELNQQLKSVKDNYAQTKSLVDGNLKAVQLNLAHLQEVKDQDMAKLLAKLDIGNYDLLTIGRSLLGPKINGWLDMGLGWMSMAKKYMPPKKVKPPKKERFKGLTIVFPNNKTMPRVLIRNIAVSGEQVSTADVLAYSGTIKNITSEPALLGKPIIIDIRGAYKKSPASKLLIAGVLDHTKDTAQDSVDILISGYDLAGAQFWDAETIPLAITGGRGIIKGKIKITGEELNGKLSFIGTQMKFKPTTVVAQDSLQAVVMQAIQSAPQLTAEIGLSGSLDAPQIALSTNLDKLIAARLNAVVGEKLNAVKKQLEDQYNKEVGAATAQINQQAAAATKKVNAQMAEQQKAIEAKQQELVQKKQEIEQHIAAQMSGVTKELKGKVSIPGLKF